MQMTACGLISVVLGELGRHHNLQPVWRFPSAYQSKGRFFYIKPHKDLLPGSGPAGTSG